MNFSNTSPACAPSIHINGDTSAAPKSPGCALPRAFGRASYRKSDRGLAAGDFVFNTNGWAEYGLMGEGVARPGYMIPRKLDPDRGESARRSAFSACSASPGMRA